MAVRRPFLRSRMLPAGVAALGLAVACEDDPGLVVRQDIQVDELQQAAAARVDILWVVDNSQTMLDEQTLLAENFDRFISNLIFCQGTGFEEDRCDLETATCQRSGLPCQPPDYHVGVVSTDPRDEGRLRAIGVCAPDVGVPPANGRVRYCSDRPNACAPDPDDPESDPENGICDRVTAPLRFVTPATPRGGAAFSELVRVRLAAGAATGERGIQAASQAVGRGFRNEGGDPVPVPAPEENDGFLRDDASLFVIFVSDEEDGTFGPIPFHYRNLETVKGVGNEGLVSLSAIVGDPDLDGSNGDDFDGGCGDPEDAAGLFSGQPGTRYVQLSMYSRGVRALQACDGTRLTCPQGRSCIRPVPDLLGLCLPDTCERDGDCGRFSCGEGLCAQCAEGSCGLEAPAFVQVLEQAGVFSSICAEDYGAVLDQLGFDAAGLDRQFPLTRLPDCSEPIPCCDEGTTCDERAPLCVRVGGEVLPFEAGAWRYDPGRNAVFFPSDVVPPARASVVLSYRATETGRAVGCESLVQGG
ncbi:MAG TPA: hypothetical protein RMG48_00060 [Myxococcales bacterium LLY-WYZ-16_1]|nr:hypothetical protein [Myxococcales bacterium LLY-WYZ-16_1]